MRKNLLAPLALVGFLCSGVMTFGQTTYSKRINHPADAGANEGMTIRKMSGNYVILAPANPGFYSEFQDVVIVSTNSGTGETENLNYVSNDFLWHSIVPRVNKGVLESDTLVVPITLRNPSNSSNLSPMIVKISPDLDYEIFYLKYDTIFNARVLITKGNDTSYIMCSTFVESGTNQEDIYISKISESGELVWRETILGTSPGASETTDLICTNIIPTNLGDGYLLSVLKLYSEEVNICTNSLPKANRVIIKIDNLGQEVWRKEWGNCATEGPPRISLLSSGGYIYCSNSVDPLTFSNINLNWSFPLLSKIDEEGNTIWSYMYGESRYLKGLSSVLETEDGDIVSVGQSRNNQGSTGLVLKTDSNGIELWTREYVYENTDGNVFQCSLNDFILDDDGSLACLGSVHPDAQQNQRSIWLLKLDEYGCLEPGCHVGIEEEEGEASKFKVGPNPFDETLNVFVKEDLGANATFSLLDNQGKVVRFFKAQNAGATHIVPTEDLSAGVYFLRLVVGDKQVESQKILKR